MIIIKYLVRETLKSQISILFILLLIFFCQNLVRVLGNVVDGDIPINVVFYLLLLSVPKMVQLMLPLSLFLGLLMTFRRLYIESEVTAIYACGLGKRTLIISAIFVSIITSSAAAVNVFWANPIISRYQDLAVTEARANPSVSWLSEGQFKFLEDGNTVLFIGKITGSVFNKIFLAQLKMRDSERPFVLVADHGKVSLQKDGSQMLSLDKGTCFEGTTSLHDFRITAFNNYRAVIGHRIVTSHSTRPEQMLAQNLWHSENPEMSAEFHWRLTLVISVILMALLAVPLSVVNPRESPALSTVLAILLYFIFFLLQTTLRSSAAKGQLDPALWLWGVNIIYLSIALTLNLWDTAWMCKLRSHLRGVI